MARAAKRCSLLAKNIAEIGRVADETFLPVDFMWASDANVLVYDFIIDWMKAENERRKYSNGI